MVKLKASACQDAGAEPGVAEILDWVGKKAELELDFDISMPWYLRYAAVDSGELDFCWICGAPYVCREQSKSLSLLVGPVMEGGRYGGAPVYLSDLLVRRDSGITSEADLKGKRMGLNEAGSQSGCKVVAWWLAERGWGWDYFQSVELTGGHRISIEKLREGTIDAAAIDTTVFDTMVREGIQDPDEFLCISTLGPSPIPCWVIQKTVPEEVKERLIGAWTNMHTDPDGQAILKKHGYLRFDRLGEEEYARPLKAMLEKAGAGGTLDSEWRLPEGIATGGGPSSEVRSCPA